MPLLSSAAGSARPHLPARERVPAIAGEGLESALATSDIELIGRVENASNLVLVGELTAAPEQGEPARLRCVYKPARGERPLWDFPGAVLARHEVAAYRVARTIDDGLVPVTVWREDLQAGPGAVQVWVDDEPTDDVAVFPVVEFAALAAASDETAGGGGWLPVLRGEDEHSREVVVAHRDTPRLASLALLDVVINNADRKASHLLGNGPAVRGIDHGVAFHPEWKLRTVLWGLAGRELSGDQLGVLARVRDAAESFSLSDDGMELLPPEALDALVGRIDDLAAAGVFPGPRPGWPVVPWPLW